MFKRYQTPNMTPSCRVPTLLPDFAEPSSDVLPGTEAAAFTLTPSSLIRRLEERNKEETTWASNSEAWQLHRAGFGGNLTGLRISDRLWGLRNGVAGERARAALSISDQLWASRGGGGTRRGGQRFLILSLNVACKAQLLVTLTELNQNTLCSTVLGPIVNTFWLFQHSDFHTRTTMVPRRKLDLDWDLGSLHFHGRVALIYREVAIRLSGFVFGFGIPKGWLLEQDTKRVWLAGGSPLKWMDGIEVIFSCEQHLIGGRIVAWKILFLMWFSEIVGFWKN